MCVIKPCLEIEIVFHLYLFPTCYVFEVFITQMVAKEIKFFIMLLLFYAFYVPSK